jgi:dolichyl-phosphate-mannose-protein mannosyltransferase
MTQHAVSASFSPFRLAVICLQERLDARTKAALLGGIGLLFLFVAQGIVFIRANAQTVDEALHLAAGYSYLTEKDFRLEPQNPPLLKEVLALPFLLRHGLSFRPDPRHWRKADGYSIGQDLLYKSTLPAERILRSARLPNLLLGTILVAAIGWWAYRLWGRMAAMLAMALASLEPNLVAHSSLITTDIGVTLFIFLDIYLFWEYVSQPRWVLLVAAGIGIGLALLTKFSAVLIIPILTLIVALCLRTARPPYVLLPIKQNQIDPPHKLLQAITVLSLLLLIALLTIPSGYFFQGFQPWLSGFYEFLRLSQEGLPAFFFGTYSAHGWWSYFPAAFLIKTPLGSLGLIAASLVLSSSGSPLGYRQFLFLLLPVILIFLAMSQANTNIGLRHVLPIYPFLFVLASRTATLRFRRPLVALLLIGLPLTWTAISALRIAPHQLAYFNELVGGPEEGYRYLSDSNLDWGQDLKALKAYIDKEKLPIIYLSYFGTAPPSYYRIRYQDVASKGAVGPPPPDKVPLDAPRKILAISAYNLQDVSNADAPLFRWLRTRQPIAKIGYSIFVYDLSRDQEGMIKLEEAYLRTGLQSLNALPQRPSTPSG